MRFWGTSKKDFDEANFWRALAASSHEQLLELLQKAVRPRVSQASPPGPLVVSLLQLVWHSAVSIDFLSAIHLLCQESL